MKWRNTDEIIPQVGALCLVKGLERLVVYGIWFEGAYWYEVSVYGSFTCAGKFKEWVYFDEVLELLEEEIEE